MVTIKVKDKEYKIRFGYKVLCDTDVIDNVVKITSVENPSVKDVMEVISNLLLAGLQKYHSNEFGYDKVGIDVAKQRVYDLMDDYEDEGTEENPQDCYELFTKIQTDLFETGFFKRVLKETGARKIPEKSTKVSKSKS